MNYIAIIDFDLDGVFLVKGTPFNFNKGFNKERINNLVTQGFIVKIIQPKKK